MSRGRQYIQFEGYFAESVLGIFRTIRGFADLRDLAAVSVPYEMTGHETQPRRVIGYQRELNEKHAQDIKKYLEQSDNRFIPEAMFSARVPVNLVDVEARYALKHHEQNRLIYLFEPQDTEDRVPFDLNPFKYVPVSQAAEIPGKLQPEIIAILKDAGAIIDGGD